MYVPGDCNILLIYVCDTIQEHKAEGCILEVDLEYPENMHNLHNDYLLDT